LAVISALGGDILEEANYTKIFASHLWKQRQLLIQFFFLHAFCPWSWHVNKRLQLILKYAGNNELDLQIDVVG